jgi:hypothetical protein
MDLVDRSRMEANQALMTLPLQRAGLQIGANQALFQQLTGAANPVLSSLLQERLAQPTTTQTQSGMGLGQIMQLGGLAGTALGGLGSLGGLFGGSPGMPAGGIGGGVGGGIGIGGGGGIGGGIG